MLIQITQSAFRRSQIVFQENGMYAGGCDKAELYVNVLCLFISIVFFRWDWGCLGAGLHSAFQVNQFKH